MPGKVYGLSTWQKLPVPTADLLTRATHLGRHAAAGDHHERVTQSICWPAGLPVSGTTNAMTCPAHGLFWPPKCRPATSWTVKQQRMAIRAHAGRQACLREQGAMAARRRLRHLSLRSTLERLARQGLPRRLMAAQVPSPHASTPSSSASVSCSVLRHPQAVSSEVARETGPFPAYMWHGHSQSNLKHITWAGALMQHWAGAACRAWLSPESCVSTVHTQPYIVTYWAEQGSHQALWCLRRRAGTQASQSLSLSEHVGYCVRLRVFPFLPHGVLRGDLLGVTACRA